MMAGSFSFGAKGVRAGVNAVTAALVVGVGIGLALTPDGRAWLARPTLLLGETANASATPSVPTGETSPSAMTAVAPHSLAEGALREKAARGQLRIGVFGDSMADGVWAALYRDLRIHPGVTVTKFSEVSTGLSRYDYVNVQTKTAGQIAGEPIDAAVILFGTNDGQAIELDGVIHDFGSEEWKAAYARRIDDLVGLLRGQGIVVYWVGLPEMKRASFDEKMNLINEVVASRMAALGVPFIETETLTRDAAGEYDAYLSDPDTGRRRLMRLNDGIHMTMAGYIRIAEPVADRIRRDAGLERAAESSDG